MIINSGLRDFQFTRQITSISNKGLSGTIEISSGNQFEFIESMAQLASLHVRWLVKLEKHTFLLSVSDTDLFTEKKIIPKEYKTAAKLIQQSSNSYKYNCTINLEIRQLKGTILIATKDYDLNFKKEQIQQEYKRIFSCLNIDLGRN